MHIDEVIVSFPIDKTKVTKQGTVRKSNVIGKTSSGHLVYADEITGLPMLRNKHGLSFYAKELSPGVYDVPDHFDDEKKPDVLWAVIDKDMHEVIDPIYRTRKEAEKAALRINHWQRRNVEIRQF